MIATAEIGPATVKGITAHEKNDRSAAQTRRALKEMVEYEGVETDQRANGKPGPNPTVYWVTGGEP